MKQSEVNQLATQVYEARRRLLGQALQLAATEVGPDDETKSAHYDASLELYEDLLDRAAIEYVDAQRAHALAQGKFDAEVRMAMTVDPDERSDLTSYSPAGVNAESTPSLRQVILEALEMAHDNHPSSHGNIADQLLERIGMRE